MQTVAAACPARCWTAVVEGTCLPAPVSPAPLKFQLPRRMLVSSVFSACVPCCIAACHQALPASASLIQTVVRTGLFSGAPTCAPLLRADVQHVFADVSCPQLALQQPVQVALLALHLDCLQWFPAVAPALLPWRSGTTPRSGTWWCCPWRPTCCGRCFTT